MMDYLINEFKKDNTYENIELLKYMALENRMILEIILRYLIGSAETKELMPEIRKKVDEMFKNMNGDEDDGKEE